MREFLALRLYQPVGSECEANSWTDRGRPGKDVEKITAEKADRKRRQKARRNLKIFWSPTA